MEKGKNQEEFYEALANLQQSVVSLVTLIADGRPIGMILVLGAPMHVEPHADFFPWATPREKLETIVNFLNEIRRQVSTFIFSSEKDTPFFNHICKYGILRRGCKVHHYFGDKDAMLFYTRRIK